MGSMINISAINFSKQINLSSALTSILVSLNASQVGKANAYYTFSPKHPVAQRVKTFKLT